MRERKPRGSAVQWHFEKKTAVNGVKIHPDGRVELLMDGVPLVPDRAHSEVIYERPKGPKVLTRSYVSGARLPLNPLTAIGTADRFYWIDTNSERHRGHWVHATSVVIGEPTHGPRYTIIKFQTMAGFEFRGDVEAPERLAWCEVIQRIRRNPHRLLNWRIILVVDSDLNLLSDFNARRTPVWGDFLLPPGFEFLYASADVGKELGLNAGMSRCDRSAAALLRHVIREDSSGALLSEHMLVANIKCRRWEPVD